jgi:hypothetical protein
MSKIILIIYLLFISKDLMAIDFLDCVSDVPVNKDIIEIKDSCFLFDSDTGKITSVEAQTNLNNTTILEFYKSILSQFGWVLKNEKSNTALVFIRDDEILKININYMNNTNIISYNMFLILKND